MRRWGEKVVSRRSGGGGAGAREMGTRGGSGERERRRRRRGRGRRRRRRRRRRRGRRVGRMAVDPACQWIAAFTSGGNPVDCGFTRFHQWFDQWWGLPTPLVPGPCENAIHWYVGLHW